ncbi:HAD domain-containing protein [Cryobacterium sp. N21]|uniref:HAD domain-containing protein n=1 Tax=Cryobacterium sp. N21 TaxID=2048289 RepID=UPI000CE391C1|nr:HAD domain-containing protein [Cryobacterium sp. N21]
MSVPRLYLSVNGCLCPRLEPDPAWGDVAKASISVEHGDGHASTRNVHWAPRLITALDSLLMQYGVELVWLTSWNELDATRQLLVPELHGLSGGRMLDVTTPPKNPGQTDGETGLWKSQRIEEDQSVPAPFIWIDDADVQLHGDKVLSATQETPSLLIPPRSEVGLTVDDIARMRTWLEQLPT